MRNTLLLICLTTFSCTNNAVKTATQLSQHDSILVAVGFDTTADYVDKSCLYYKGKRLLTLGQNVELLDTTFSSRPDPNGAYQNFYRLGITDYLSLDDFYSAKLSTGTIDGILFFSTEKKKRVFRLVATFEIDADLVDTSGMEIMNYMQGKYFPCLPPDIKGRRSVEVTHENFVEQFRLYPSPDSADLEHSFKPHWSLVYTLTPTKKKGT